MPSLTSTQLQGFERAVAAFRAGNLSEARAQCHALIAVQPDLFEAWFLSACIDAAYGRHHEAVAAYDKALAMRPNNVGALAGRGNILKELNRLDEALASYEAALKIAPDAAYLHYNRANLLKDLKRLDDALSAYDAAVTIQPGFSEALNNRGNVLRELRQYGAALDSYDNALAIRPDNVEALNNRALSLVGMGRVEEALAGYDRALAIRRDADTLSNRAAALSALSRFDEALAHCDEALAMAPDNADACNNRGSALKGLYRFEEALASYDRAVALRPDFAAAYCNRGICLQEMGRCDDALASLQSAIALKPDLPEARFALCMAELPIIYMDEAEIDVRRAAYEARLRTLCAAGEDEIGSSAFAAAIGWSQPFYLPYQGHNDRDLQALYGSFVCRVMSAHYPPAPPAPPPAAHEPVRVGIVSGFFRQHANWSLPIKGWLSQIDRARFRVFGYHTGVVRQPETIEALAMCERFVQGPLPIARWRAEILADAPHVLIYPEVGMDGVAAQLAAQRLAAVQCNAWGHPETSGFPTLDYFLSSDLMEPRNGQDHYTERLVRLPNLSVYCEPLASHPAAVTRAELGLRATATVYWCCQSLYKYLPGFDDVFVRIAREAGDCQFAFICLNSAPINARFRKRLEAAFAARGLRADDHCVFLPRLGRDAFVAASGLCDVFLDSIGWSGCNSVLECLVHDLPIVTLPGPLMRGRHCMAFLTMMGVTGTIATNVDDFVAIAVRLAHDAAWRGAMRASIAANKHRLYRDRDCITALERFLDRVGRSGAPG